ncbi:hypothetical protein BDR05DRAFT_978242 [Suillus weaverae]|nr:hypothetical protein BDR05DRAFT_978242 [Suillus weaverae]
MGHYGNGASLEDIAHYAGISAPLISEGSVEKFTEQCFTAIEALHDAFVCLPTREEKEAEKCWGWVMYDGTIVVLYAKPGLNGDAYFTRKVNYGLNLQIGNLASNLCIVDYLHGLTGSTHDASAFEHTAAFAWVDSAYPVSVHTIPVHKQPTSLLPENTLFDSAVAHLRVRSEHCMGALKGRWQCLRGLHINISLKHQHRAACQWMTIAIILHNVVIDVEGATKGEDFAAVHTRPEEEEDRGPADLPMEDNEQDVEELLAFRQM